MKYNLIVAVFLGNLSLTEAVKLHSHHKHRWYTPKDPHEHTEDKHVKRYEDAAKGILKTEKEYKDEEDAIYPGNVYKKTPNFKVAEDDTGEKYVTTHRCFGGPCKDDRSLL